MFPNHYEKDSGRSHAGEEEECWEWEKEVCPLIFLPSELPTLCQDLGFLAPPPLMVDILGFFRKMWSPLFPYYSTCWSEFVLADLFWSHSGFLCKTKRKAVWINNWAIMITSLVGNSSFITHLPWEMGNVKFQLESTDKKSVKVGFILSQSKIGIASVSCLHSDSWQTGPVPPI